MQQPLIAVRHITTDDTRLAISEVTQRWPRQCHRSNELNFRGRSRQDQAKQNSLPLGSSMTTRSQDRVVHPIADQARAGRDQLGNLGAITKRSLQPNTRNSASGVQ